MSEAAIRTRDVKRHWAEPGGRHDRVVKLAKFALPVVVLGLVAMLAIAPFDKRDDVSFILDKKGVDKATERMRIEQARYAGEDNKGNKFVITADRAIQQSSDVPVVDDRGDEGRARPGPGAAADRRRTAAITISTRRWCRSTGRCAWPAATAIGWRPAMSRST